LHIATFAFSGGVVCPIINISQFGNMRLAMLWP
jgi:hypothetical protein